MPLNAASTSHYKIRPDSFLHLSLFRIVSPCAPIVTLSVVNHEELLLIRAKLDELMHQIGDDHICTDHFFDKLHHHIDWFEDVKEELALDTVG